VRNVRVFGYLSKCRLLAVGIWVFVIPKRYRVVGYRKLRERRAGDRILSTLEMTSWTVANSFQGWGVKKINPEAA